MIGTNTTRSVQLLFSLLLLMGGVVAYFYLFGGPYRFVQFPLREASLQHLRSGGAASTPEDAADEYLHGLVHPLDRPKRERLEIAIRYSSDQEAVVTVIDRFCQDDSLFVTCDKLTLRKDAGIWLPVLHEAAWQGRGHIGWTTKPTL